jgi:4'-phosphopantetheinyl transferase
VGGHIPSLELAAQYFSTREVTRLQACHESARDAHFIELWTLKEAYVKAIGAGLSHPLSSFSVLFNGSSFLRFEPATREQSMWQFALFAPSAGHRMAVAVPCATRKPRQITTWVNETDTTAATVLRTLRPSPPLPTPAHASSPRA